MTSAGTTQLGPYQIVRSLGAGGMGEVYLARDTRLNRLVAIKILAPHLSEDPHFRTRLEHEARTLSRLNHPHVCTLYDVGRDADTTYLVMEYLEGETLASRLQREFDRTHSGLSLSEALDIGMAIAAALDVAHRQGITHRDLKPGNVMLTRAGVKLVDFGLAKAQAGLPLQPPGPSAATIAGGLGGSPVTATGTIVGTFQYMAPEQLEGKTADARTDIFALGAVLHEMVSGRRAFEADTGAALIASILKDDPPPLSSIQPSSPRVLDFVVRKCLARSPDDRWQSAADVRSQLQWAAEEIRSVAPLRAVKHRRAPGAREMIAWTLAAVLAAISGVALWTTRSATVPQRESDVRFDIPTPQGSAISLSISPDGRRIAYLARARDGVNDVLWVRALASTVAEPIAGTEGAAFPFWSPDGRSIGFAVAGAIRRVEAAGGAPRTVCAYTGFEAGPSAWSTNNTIVFSNGRTLFRVSAEGGSPSPLTTLDANQGESGHSYPAFLPDGNHVLFAIDSTDPTRAGIYVTALDSTERTRLVEAVSTVAYAEPGFILFQKSGILLAQRFDPRKLQVSGTAVAITDSVTANPWSGTTAFAVSQAGPVIYRGGGPQSRQLQWFDRRGTPLERIGEPAYFWSLALSPDEKRVAEARPDGDRGRSDVWTVDLSTGVPSRVTFSPGNDDDPTWMPDGRALTFWSDRTGDYGIYNRTLGSSEDVLLYASKSPTYLGSWSPDAKFLLFHDSQAIHAIPSTGRPEPIRLIPPGYKRDEPRFSPDGHWVAYSSTESGSLEVYVASFPAFGEKRQVSLGGGGVPWWRGDGQELFYMTREGKVMSVPVKASPLEFGKPTMLFESPMHSPSLISAQYAVAGSGERFLVAVPPTTTPPITVVLDWTKLLPR